MVYSCAGEIFQMYQQKKEKMANSFPFHPLADL